MAPGSLESCCSRQATEPLPCHAQIDRAAGPLSLRLRQNPPPLCDGWTFAFALVQAPLRGYPRASHPQPGFAFAVLLMYNTPQRRLTRKFFSHGLEYNMKNWKRLLALLLTAAMALSLFACGSGDGNESPSAAPSAGASADPGESASPAIVADLTQPVLEFAAGVSPTDTMLTVNGQDVPADLFLYLLGMNCLNMQTYLPYLGMSLADAADTVLEESLSMTLYHVLIRQRAAELGCLLTDAQAEEVRTALEEADLEANAVPYWGLTDESAEFIFAMNTYYDNVYEATTHAPTTEELNAYLYRVKHILLKTVDDSRQPLPEDQVAEKRAQAEDLLAQLQAADDLPARFDELMMAHSEDNPQNNPGGYLAAPGDMVAPFEEASLALKDGELSGIVESEFGYHIILRLPTDVTDEELAENDYAGSFRQNALDELIAQWREEAVVTQSDALKNLDVAVFYDRLAAYHQALAEQESAAGAPVESGGVG